MPKKQTKPVWPERGWYGDKDDPSSVVYWDGEAWGNRAPKPASMRPESVWRRARGVAIGILAAVAALVVIGQVINMMNAPGTPSDAYCRELRTQKALGYDTYVPTDCY